MKRLKELRAERGLTQIELARMVGHDNRVTIHNWENGNSEPNVASLKRLARIFGVSIDELVGLKPPSPPPLPDSAVEDYTV